MTPSHATFLVELAAILVGAKLLGEIAERFRQPAVLGELTAGVLLGPSLLGFVHPDTPQLALLAEIGVIVLLFEIGLETDLKKLLRVGGASATVAVVGVAAPFVMGYAAMRLLGHPAIQSVVVGAALTATSVGITARVLSDLGTLRSAEGQIVLGAAVIDDVIGLIILAVVGGLVAGEPLTIIGIVKTTSVAFGFLAVVLLLGRFIIPPAFSILAALGRPESLAIMALAVAFALSVIAQSVGSALIVGAFAAGLVLAPSEHARKIEEGTIRIAQFFVPVFFVSVGAAVDVRAFADTGVLAAGALLIAVAVIGKIVAGYAPFWFRGRKSVIGVGMVPRGEVGLIFAQTGLTSGVLTPGLFGAIMLMVVVTTFSAPPVLRALFRSEAGVGREGPAEEAGGVAEMTTEV